MQTSHNTIFFARRIMPSANKRHIKASAAADFSNNYCRTYDQWN